MAVFGQSLIVDRKASGRRARILTVTFTKKNLVLKKTPLKQLNLSKFTWTTSYIQPDVKGLQRNFFVFCKINIVNNFFATKEKDKYEKTLLQLNPAAPVPCKAAIICLPFYFTTNIFYSANKGLISVS